jgi:hypothetical protein
MRGPTPRVERPLRRALAALAAAGMWRSLVALAALLAVATPARASYEEFATLDVLKQEEDDENLLDHVLVRQPIEWRDDWERARGAFRSSQGCFTSGQWYLDHELRMRVPMGDTTRLDLEIRDVSDAESVYGWTQFDFRFPLPRLGLWGVRVRPSFDKSRQDLALLWDHGTPLAGLHVHLAMGLEDFFNKLWSMRQTRVGDESEPYVRHPFEPAFRAGWRSERTRIELGGKWLTPSEKRIETADPALRRREDLWGVKGDGLVSERIGPVTAQVAFETAQAQSEEHWDAIATYDHHFFRRRWRVDGALTHPLGAQGRLTARFLYQERSEVIRPLLADASFDVIDRMPMLEVAGPMPFDFFGRAGFLRNRVTTVQHGILPHWTWGTRVETRAFVALQKQFGSVMVQGIECVEFDREFYDVAFIHDKGFLQVQVLF